MLTVNDLLNRAKANSGAGSDYRLALDMGIHPNRIYAWRAEREFPPADHLLSLAEMAGDSPGYWYCIIQARKSDRASVAQRWRAAAEDISPEQSAA